MRFIADPVRRLARRPWRVTVADYALAVILTSMFGYIRLSGPITHAEVFLGWSLPIMLAAWVGGFGPGMTATATAAIWAQVLDTTAHDMTPGRAINSMALVMVGVGISTLLARRALSSMEVVDLAEELRLLKLHILTAVVTCNAHGSIVSLNPAAMRLFGYTGREITGKPLTCIVRFDSDPAADLARFLLDMAASPAGHNLRLRGVARGGEAIPLRLSVYAHRWHGEIRTTLAIWRAGLADQYDDNLLAHGHGP